ncbi:MAG: monovalent cation/H+ antiporter subunit D family protein [Nitrospirae bacterium]|nr:monovalent cation/H+ antiporter subunit D family protein [Nitrospirota bacterium]
MMMEHLPAIIIVFPLIMAFLINVAGWWSKKACFYMALLAVTVSFLASLGILNTVLQSGTISYRFGGWEPPWGIEYVIDHLNAFMLVIVSGITLPVVLYSKKSIEQELPKKIPQFYTLFTLLMMGLLGITITGDAFNLYVLLEIASITGYALIGLGDEKAPLASFNYLIIGTIGACFYLLGVGYLYIMTGSLNMADLAQRLPALYSSNAVMAAFAFFMVGIAIKMAFFPLHVWLPDAYSHAPSTVSAYVACTMTKVGAYVMIRIMFTVFEPSFSIQLHPVTTIFGWVAAAAMMYGCILAVAQNDLKRMLCYIIIAEVGYIVMGISAANRMGFTGAVLHILNDAFMMACLFLVVGAIYYKTGAKTIGEYRGLFKKMPFTSMSFAVGALSVVGVPPTCGFFSKWYLVLGTINAEQWVFAAALLASSLLSAIVFFRVLQNMFFAPAASSSHDQGSESHVQEKRHEAPGSMLIPIFVTIAGILLLGVFSGQIIEMIIQYTVPEGF